MNGIDGGQGEAVRVPLTDGTLVKVPGSGHSDETVASLLTLSDVMCTGHHAAVSAEVKQGDTVAVVMRRSVCLPSLRRDVNDRGSTDQGGEKVDTLLVAWSQRAKQQWPEITRPFHLA